VKTKIFLVALFLGSLQVMAQHEFLPFSNDYQRYFEAFLLDTNSENIHTSVRTFRRSEVNKIIDLDSLQQQFNFYEGSNWVMRKLFNEHFFEVNKDDFQLSVSPIVHGQLGVDRTDGTQRRTYQNTRGAWVEGAIGKQVTFFTLFTENQARFPGYVNSWIDSSRVIPGQGFRRNFKDGDHDYANAYGAVSYTPSKYFNFSLGQGKHFFGEGHRSAFLSDNAFNYPYFRIESTFWNVKYVNLWTQMYDIRQEVQLDKSYRKKWMSAHYLSWNITKRLGLQVYEAVIIGADENNQGLDVSFLNPIVFYRPIEYASRSRGKKVVLGGGLTYKLTKGLMAYSQFLLDEFVFSEFTGEPGSWRNKYTWQLGAKYGQHFGKHRVFTLLEFNGSRPYTYQHNFIESNYAHYSEALAHPWGANFREMVWQFNYGYKRFTFDAQLSGGVVGLDSAGSNWGNNPFLNYNQGSGAPNNDPENNGFNNWIGQGVRMNQLFVDARVGYIVNPKTNLRLETGATLRSLKNANPTSTRPDSRTVFVYFGLRTGIFNNYYDF